MHQMQEKSRLKSKRDLYREWLIPESLIAMGWRPRYAGLRGIYWYWLSRDVRKKEWEALKGCCFTCKRPLASWEDGQCGHIIPASWCGERLRFDRRNLTIQCGKCNNPRFSPHSGLVNAINYDDRNGAGTFKYLMAEVKMHAKEPTQAEYRQLIRELDSFKEAYAKAQEIH